jgi:vacuolar-type H+-ATPase subunit I/STV1
MTDSEMLAMIRALLPDTYSESKDWRGGNVTERIMWLKFMVESKTEEVDRLIDILNGNRIKAQAAEIERLRSYISAQADRIQAQAAEIERLRDDLKKEIEEKLDAISTLDAWFDRRKLAHDSLDQAVVDAASGYLRTSRCGGMKQKDSDLVLAVIQNMARLSVFADLFARSTLAELKGDKT